MANTAFQDAIPDPNDPDWNKMSDDALKHKRATENLSRKEAGLEPLPEVKEVVEPVKEVKVEEVVEPVKKSGK